VLVAITYIVFRRTLFGSVQERALAAFLLAAPALLPHFAYLSGDLDRLLYCCAALAVAAFLELPGTRATFCAAVLSVVALLIHEAYLLLFYPLVIAIMVDLCRRQRLRAGTVIAQLVIVVIAMLAITTMADGACRILNTWPPRSSERTCRWKARFFWCSQIHCTSSYDLSPLCMTSA
jgi:hypothetical protein